MSNPTKYFTSTAFVEIESQTMVTKANSLQYRSEDDYSTADKLVHGHTYCCLLLSVKLETIISEAVAIHLLSNPYPPPRAQDYYAGFDNIASLVPKMSVQY